MIGNTIRTNRDRLGLPLTIVPACFSILPYSADSHRERWRDWPYETAATGGEVAEPIAARCQVQQDLKYRSWKMWGEPETASSTERVARQENPKR